MFIAFEGIDGCGKTTVISLCRDMLKHACGEHMKVQVLNDFVQLERNRKSEMTGEKNPLAQYFKIMSARIATRTFIDQYVGEDTIILYDRYLGSTLAYQSTMGISLGRIAAEHAACELPLPDLTIILDLPVHVARRRLGEPSDNVERMSDGFFADVAGIYRWDVPNCMPCVIVDADRPLATVVPTCMQLIVAMLPVEMPLHRQPEDAA